MSPSSISRHHPLCHHPLYPVTILYTSTRNPPACPTLGSCKGQAAFPLSPCRRPLPYPTAAFPLLQPRGERRAVPPYTLLQPPAGPTLTRHPPPATRHPPPATRHPQPYPRLTRLPCPTALPLLSCRTCRPTTRSNSACASPSRPCASRCDGQAHGLYDHVAIKCT